MSDLPRGWSRANVRASCVACSKPTPLRWYTGAKHGTVALCGRCGRKTTNEQLGRLLTAKKGKS